MQGRGRRLGRRSGFVALLLVVAACGSRTGLFGPEDDAPGTPVDAAIPRTDAPFPIVDTWEVGGETRYTKDGQEHGFRD